MSASADMQRGAKPRLRLVSSTLTPVRRRPIVEDWRRVAAAVVACTQDLARHLLDQRWGRVDETMRERRELIEMMGGMRLDADGRRCLTALEEAADESDRTLAAIMGSAHRR